MSSTLGLGSVDQVDQQQQPRDLTRRGRTAPKLALPPGYSFWRHPPSSFFGVWRLEQPRRQHVLSFPQQPVQRTPRRALPLFPHFLRRGWPRNCHRYLAASASLQLCQTEGKRGLGRGTSCPPLSLCGFVTALRAGYPASVGEEAWGRKLGKCAFPGLPPVLRRSCDSGSEQRRQWVLVLSTAQIVCISIVRSAVQLSDARSRLGRRAYHYY